MALSYEEGKRVFLKTILILAAITVLEVAFALLGKGYIISGIEFPHAIMGIVMVVMSVVKAYLIIYEFMHMKYEVPGMVRSVLLPMLLLVWGVIAFLWDGTWWMTRRDADAMPVELAVPMNEHADHDTHNGALHGDAHHDDHGAGHGHDGKSNHDDHGHDDHGHEHDGHGGH